MRTVFIKSLLRLSGVLYMWWLYSLSYGRYAVYHDSVEGQKYSQFYKVTDWPYVAILHPETAELKQEWGEIKLSSFLKDLRGFLSLFSSPNCTESSVPLSQSSTNSTPSKADPVVETSEESQIAAAIKASLEYSNAIKKSYVIYDSDSSEEECYSEVESSDSENSNVQEAKSTSKSSITDASNSLIKPSDDYDDWKAFISDLGTDIHILFKMPDQTRSQWSIKSQTKIKALILYVKDLGYKPEKYEIVANFPRRQISCMDPDATLESANFSKQETLYIQEI